MSAIFGLQLIGDILKAYYVCAIYYNNWELIMDYPNRLKLCATCNRWVGHRVIANTLNLPNYEIVRFDEINYIKWNSECFMFCPSAMDDYISSVGCGYSIRFLFSQNMGVGCKRYIRWCMLEITAIDKAFQFLCSKWYARRHFKKSKIRDVVDSFILKINYFILKYELYDSNLVEVTTTWLSKWVVSPIFTLMYRLKFTTHEPDDLIFSED